MMIGFLQDSRPVRGDARQPQRWTQKNPASAGMLLRVSCPLMYRKQWRLQLLEQFRVSSCRAMPEGRAERKDPSSEVEDEEDMALSSDEEDFWQSPSKDFSSGDLDLSDLGSGDGSFSSEVELEDARNTHGSREQQLDGHQPSGVRSPSAFDASLAIQTHQHRHSASMRVTRNSGAHLKTPLALQTHRHRH